MKEGRLPTIDNKVHEKKEALPIQGSRYSLLLALAGYENLSIPEISLEIGRLSKRHIYVPDGLISSHVEKLKLHGYVKEQEDVALRRLSRHGGRAPRRYFEITGDGLSVVKEETKHLHRLTKIGVEHGLLNENISELEVTLPQRVLEERKYVRPPNALYTTTKNEYLILSSLNNRKLTIDELAHYIADITGKTPKPPAETYRIVRNLLEKQAVRLDGDTLIITPLGKWQGYVDTQYLADIVNAAIDRDIIPPQQTIIENIEEEDDNETFENWDFPDSPYKSVVWQAHLEVKDTLKQESGKIGIQLLPAIHHIAEVLGDTFAAIKRVDDIVFVEKSLYGRDISHEQIQQGLEAIQRLASAYYPYAEKYAQVKLTKFDMDLASDATKQMVDTIVWKTWLPRGKTIKEISESLRRLTLSTLTHSWSHIHEENKKKKPLFTTWDRYDQDEILDHEVTKQLVNNETAKGSARNPNVRMQIKSYIREFLRDNSIEKLFSYVEQLHPRSQLVLLQLLGWFKEKWSTEEFFEKKLDRGGYKGDLMRAAKEFVFLVQTESNLECSNHVPSIADTLKKAEDHIIFRSGKRTLEREIPRCILAEASLTITPDLLPNFTDRQTQIFYLATMHTNGLLKYSLEEIAAITGYSLKLIRKEVAVMSHFFKK